MECEIAVDTRGREQEVQGVQGKQGKQGKQALCMLQAWTT